MKVAEGSSHGFFGHHGIRMAKGNVRKIGRGLIWSILVVIVCSRCIRHCFLGLISCRIFYGAWHAMNVLMMMQGSVVQPQSVTSTWEGTIMAHIDSFDR